MEEKVCCGQKRGGGTAGGRDIWKNPECIGDPYSCEEGEERGERGEPAAQPRRPKRKRGTKMAGLVWEGLPSPWAGEV